MPLRVSFAWETVISTASDNAIVKAIYNSDTGDAFDIRFQIVTMLTSTLALGILLAGHNKPHTAWSHPGGILLP